VSDGASKCSVDNLVQVVANAILINFIAAHRVTCAESEDVIIFLSEEFEDDERYRDVNNPVAVTWLISFQ
jgi:hypothetical protein